MTALLLDTCALLHLDTDRIATANVLGEIDRARDARRLFVSPITAMEVAQKASRGLRGGLDLRGRHPAGWFAEVVAKFRVREAPFTSRQAFAMYDLGPAFHGDPADRAIVATARLRGHRLVTCDGRIIAQAAASAACDVLAYAKRPGTP